jgi:SAM-dependent methyltransferase
VSLADAEMLPLLYCAEHGHGWSAGMRAITRVLLAGCDLPPGPVIELGCGGGRLLADLKSAYPDRTLHGVDLHPHALAYAAATAGAGVGLGQAHLHKLPFPAATFALCLALDAFDQRGVQLDRALAESWRILRPDGVLLLRVSAHSWLHGPHDAAFNTGHRYEKREMCHALRRVNFVPLRVTYANTLLSGPAVVVRLLQRWHIVPFLPSLYTRPAPNVLLSAALRWEARWLRTRDLPAGMSLYVAARKATASTDGRKEERGT